MFSAELESRTSSITRSGLDIIQKECLREFSKQSNGVGIFQEMNGWRKRALWMSMQSSTQVTRRHRQQNSFIR